MTINQLAEAAQQVRHQQLRKERVLLARALAPIPTVNLELARHVGAGSRPGIVSDPRRWLVPVPPIELTAAVDALLAVVRAGTIAHPLSFRIIVTPGNRLRNRRSVCSPSLVNEPTNTGKRSLVASDDSTPNLLVSSSS